MKSREHANRRPFTATHRVIPTDDYALTQEALRLASGALRDEALRLERVWPSSAMVERINVFAEQMEDLHKRNSREHLNAFGNT